MWSRVGSAAVVLVVLAATATPESAAAQTQLIGDKDCFGFGGYPCVSLANINLPEDRRSAAEAAATNGAQQTDFYSSNFAPLPSIFDVIFPLATSITSGVLTIGMGGFQASQFGQFSVHLNGVFMPDFFNFQDGITAVVERVFVLSAAQLDWVNLTNQLVLTIDRTTSSDATAFDYFQLETESGVVPEPLSMILLGTGLAGVAAARRRRKELDVA